MEAFEKFDELFEKKRILEMTTLAGQIPFLYGEWLKKRGHAPDDRSCIER